MNINIAVGQRQVVLDITSYEPGAVVRGQVQVGPHYAGFVWKLPHVLPFITVCSGDRTKAKEFVRQVILAWRKSIVLDNAGTSEEQHPDNSDDEHISRLIKAGHVRRPHWALIRGAKVLRAACVVNAANLTPMDAARAVEMIGLWNTVIRGLGRPVNFAEAKALATQGA